LETHALIPAHLTKQESSWLLAARMVKLKCLTSKTVVKLSPPLKHMKKPQLAQYSSIKKTISSLHLVEMVSSSHGNENLQLFKFIEHLLYK
jgi:hypothetical protein